MDKTVIIIGIISIVVSLIFYAIIIYVNKKEPDLNKILGLFNQNVVIYIYNHKYFIAFIAFIAFIYDLLLLILLILLLITRCASFNFFTGRKY